MANKIRMIGLSLIVAIIIGAFVAMGIVQSTSVGEVKKAEITNVSDTSVSFSWDKVSGADGYFIYEKSSSDKEFTKALDIKNGKDKSGVLEDLKQATAYDFYVTAYKTKGKNVYESKKFLQIKNCTLPSKEVVNAESPDEGVLKMSWQENDSVAGYELSYGKDEQTVVDVDDVAQTSKVVEGLTPKDVYNVKMRSYVLYNKEKLYGEWSDDVTVTIAQRIVLADDIDPTKPMVALTFDDGPGYNSCSDDILDVLEKYNAKATFFMLGKNAADHPDNLKRKVKLGMEIGNHTYDHSRYGKNVTTNDIKKASDAIYKACGVYPTAFRSPGGNTTSTILNECKAENMPLYYWSLDTEDWKSRNADKVYDTVMKHVKDGDIILMHEIYSSTADAVAKIVPALIEQGYQLVTCEQLIAVKSGANPQAGQQYVNATTINNKTS